MFKRFFIKRKLQKAVAEYKNYSEILMKPSCITFGRTELREVMKLKRQEINKLKQKLK